jgi:hypothetical protein
MRNLFDRVSRFFGRTLDPGPRGLLVLAAALLVATAFLPLWNLTMFAPQYPDGLRLDIYAYGLIGGNGGQDVKEINVLNHYIGMRDLVEEDFTEFAWMPFVIGALALLILRTVVHGTAAALVDVTVLFFYFGVFSLGSFAYKLYRYGHDLAPTAAVRVDPFMPPLFGYRQIANFEVYSYPQAASYALGVALLLLIAALLWTWRAARRDVAAPVAA